jgi:hypothetical protein
MISENSMLDFYSFIPNSDEMQIYKKRKDNEKLTKRTGLTLLKLLYLDIFYDIKATFQNSPGIPPSIQNGELRHLSCNRFWRTLRQILLIWSFTAKNSVIRLTKLTTLPINSEKRQVQM